MQNRSRFVAAAILLAFSAFANGDDPPQPKSEIPKTISDEQVRLILRRAIRSVQGCGVTTWNGKAYGWYFNNYKPVKLPWSLEPQFVSAGFIQGSPPGNNTLIEFSGPGFRYKRLNDEPILTLEVVQPK